MFDRGKMGMKGKVTFVGAGPGDPELITVRGSKALERADVILYDSLVDRALLESRKARLMFVGKRRGEHSMPQEDINRLLAQRARKGEQVVRLKGGDCSVFGRLGEEVLYLAERNIPFEIVPGVTSATAAPIFAGIPVTHRGLADSFAVVTAHRRAEEMGLSVPPYNPSTTVVLMMALGATEVWQGVLLSRGYPPELPVAFVSAAGSAKQRVLVTTVGGALHDVQDAGLQSPTLAVVGRVVTLRGRMQWYEGSSETAGDSGVQPLLRGEG